jgi:hypothetical protein
MRVDVGEISRNLTKLDTDLSNFESLYHSIFREVDIAKSYWNDGNANVFASKMEEEKSKSKELYDELSSRRDIYKYVRDEYSRSGNVINFDLNRKNDYLLRLNEAKWKLEEAKGKLRETIEEGLGNYSSGGAAYFVHIHNDVMDYYTRIIEECYSEVNRYLNDFENIERQTGKKIDELSNHSYSNYIPVKIPKV